MIDKLKDLIYDMSDVILSLLIIGMIFFVVSWKISDSMAFEIAVPDKPAQSVELPDTEVAVLSPSEEAAQTETNLPASEEAGSSEAKPEGGDITVIEEPAVQEITFEIKKGATGYSISKQLKELGLIEDTSAFLSRLDELELSNKLRQGTFTLKTDMSTDDIIYKLSGR